MNTNNETNGVELVFIGIVVFFLAVMVWLMTTFGVEWQTAMDTTPNLIIWFIAVGGGIFFAIKTDNSLVIWGAPLAIAMLIPVFKPILKEAAGVRDIGGYVFNNAVSWYGTAWGMTLIFSLILVFGYGLLYLWHERH